MSPEPAHHAVRRVVLPSGRTIEVVYFSGPDPAVGADGTVEGLHVCPRCEAPYVQPLDWSEAGPGHWEVSLRCPSCEWHGDGIFAQEVVERFEEELASGWEELSKDLERLERANMEDQVDRFVSALRAGHLYPMDF
ncbi:MAG: hypothetical protein U0T02_07410 [Solirubrobacteraceae bacterium]